MAKPSLLLVDDDKNTLDGLVRILKCEGYSVSGVLSGSDALKLLSKEKFDVMITDINMPGMNGLSLIREVKKRKVPIAIVVITANCSFKSGVGAVKSTECDYYLTKPVNVEMLKLVLEKLWERQRLITQNQLLKKKIKIINDLIQQTATHRKILDNIIITLCCYLLREVNSQLN